jgi:LPS-assembly lipoprotein
MRADRPRLLHALARGWVLGAALVLAACGFQLRGSAELPFESLWIEMPESNPLGAELKRNLRSGTRTRVAARRDEAEAVLLPTREQRGKTILSLSSSGRVREFRLSYSFEFRVADQRGRDLIDPVRLMIERDFPFNDNQVLSKELEEALMYREMQTDIVQQVLRRLAAAQRVPVKG